MPVHSLLDINLLPKDSFEQSSLGRTMKWMLTGGRAIVVITEFAVIIAFGSRFWFDKTLNDLNETVNQKQSVVESFNEVETKMRDILSREEVVNQFEKSKYDINGVFASLKVATPMEVVFSRISVGESGLMMDGSAKSEASFAGFLANMTRNPKIVSMSLGETKFSQRSGEISFSLVAELGTKGGAK